VHVSILLPVHNGEPWLRKQLEALERQKCSFPWEVIVIDNASTDESARTAKEFEARLPAFQLLHEDTPGKSSALNRGMAAANGRHFVFVDADDEAGEGYVQKMSESLEEFDVVGGFIDRTTLNPWHASRELASNEGMPIYYNFRPALPGCVLGMRAALCEQIGPYDVTLMSAEDIDYCWRACALGARFGRNLDAIMYTRSPPTALDAFKKARSYGRSHVWLYERYRSEGMQRRSLRNAASPLRWSVTRAIRKEGPWGWAIAFDLGLLEGRAEESMRHRVYFP
jgi:glycosyltransferase involved in cell wall biosynthesis